MTASSIYFQSFPYSIIPDSGLLDYDGLQSQSKIFKPRLIICGASAYPRDWDYGRLRNICDTEGAPDPMLPPPAKGEKAKGAWLMADIAHTSGLVAAQELNNPFEYCDVVTTTTHKTLRGPRAGLIFFRKDQGGLETRVNQAVFPACQGGPHNHVRIYPFLALHNLTFVIDYRRYCHNFEAGCLARVEAVCQADHC